jgi:hypothetical protein
MSNAYTVQLYFCKKDGLNLQDLNEKLKSVLGDDLVLYSLHKYNPSYKTTKGRKMLRYLLLDRDGKNCCWCKKPIDFNSKLDDDMSPTIEHLKRKCEGGSLSDLNNLALAHKKCNNERHK